MVMTMQSLVNRTKKTGRWIIPATCSLLMLLVQPVCANAADDSTTNQASGQNSIEVSRKNEAAAASKNATEDSGKSEAAAANKNATEGSGKSEAAAASKNVTEGSGKSEAAVASKNATDAPTRSVSTAATKAQSEIEQTIHQQKESWNRGDLDGFMSAYLNSKDICYTSAGVEVWGYDALRERYQKKYGSNKDTMGKLDFRDLKITELSPKSALAVGHWHLDRKDASPMDGTFSLVLLKKNNAWKIIHDHTSLLSEKK